jgi:hypothetical protein
MFNWFDLMRQAQGGTAMDNMARQFGLTPQQTQAAMAAFMPAFALGLQRTASNPETMAQFARLMTAGHYPNFFESAAQAFSPQAKQEGSSALQQLFGSEEVSRQVAQQAAAFSGIATDVMQQVLPLMAAILMGGMAKMAGGPAPAPAPQAPSQAGLGAWADMWSGVLKAGQPQVAAQPPAAASFEEMMATFLGKPKPPEPAPEAQKPDPFAAFGQMMEQGREMQEQYLASLKSILDGWGRPPGKP